MTYNYLPREKQHAPWLCHGDECQNQLANAGFHAPCEFLTGFTSDLKTRVKKTQFI